MRFIVPVSANNSGGGVADGDKGDIVVSGSGSTFTIDTGVIPCDFEFVAISDGTARTVGSGGWTSPMEVQRAFTVSKVVYHFPTADASGSSTVEIRRNGSQIASSVKTVTSGNQATGSGTITARTATFTQSFAVGDTFGVQLTAVGGTPGNGLRVWVYATWN